MITIKSEFDEDGVSVNRDTCYHINETYEVVPFVDEPDGLAYKACAWIIQILIAIALLFALFAAVIGTPAEMALREHNEQLTGQLEQMQESIRYLELELETLAEKDQSLYRSVMGLEPTDLNIVEAGIGGVDPYVEFDLYTERASRLLRETATRLRTLDRQMEKQSASLHELLEEERNIEERLKHIPAMKPVDGILLSGYGMRNHPVLNVRRMHRGADFRARVGTPVFATGDGVVRRSGRYGNYGLIVVIDHKHGYQTWYAHLSSFENHIKPGVTVQRGERIANSGNTGLTQGPHLHYEVRLNGRTVDPVRYMIADTTPTEYKMYSRNSHD